jgi:DNA-binding LacI/PurR family transcriptional regulator
MASTAGPLRMDEVISSRSRPVTIKDVAQAAGVTAATVSNVVRGKAIVSEATRIKVMTAIGELGYAPNLMARGLVRRASDTFAFMLPDISNAFYPEIALEIEGLAHGLGKQILLCNTLYDPRRASSYLQRLKGGIVDGVIMMDCGILPDDLLELVDHGVPTVACLFDGRSNAIPHPHLATLEVDFYEAGRLAARHLVEKGHRRIGTLMDATRDHQGGHRLRLRGVEDELATHGLCVATEDHEQTGTTIESGRTAIATLLDRGAAPTAIVTANDLIAIGAMAACHARGLAIPQDISFVGMDNIAMAANTQPTLTSVDVFKGQIAAEGMRLLSEMIANLPTPRHAVISPGLVERGSVSRRVPA